MCEKFAQSGHPEQGKRAFTDLTSFPDCCEHRESLMGLVEGRRAEFDEMVEWDNLKVLIISCHSIHVISKQCPPNDLPQLLNSRIVRNI
jgi:hypothetical protein